LAVAPRIFPRAAWARAAEGLREKGSLEQDWQIWTCPMAIRARKRSDLFIRQQRKGR